MSPHRLAYKLLDRKIKVIFAEASFVLCGTKQAWCLGRSLCKERWTCWKTHMTNTSSWTLLFRFLCPEGKQAFKSIYYQLNFDAISPLKAIVLIFQVFIFVALGLRSFVAGDKDASLFFPIAFLSLYTWIRRTELPLYFRRGLFWYFSLVCIQSNFKWSIKKYVRFGWHGLVLACCGTKRAIVRWQR